MSKKRDVLEVLRRDELLGVVDAYGLTVEDRRRKKLLIEGIARSRKAKVEDILLDLPRQRLKEISRPAISGAPRTRVRSRSIIVVFSRASFFGGWAKVRSRAFRRGARDLGRREDGANAQGCPRFFMLSQT